LVDHVSSKRRSEIMAAVRSKETKPELAVRRILHALGYRYRLHDAKLPGKPDIVFKSRKKVVFVHGCFWHRHPKCKYATIPKTKTDFWNEKFQKNVRRDRLTRSKLLDMGWECLIVWQCELKNPESLSRKMVEFLENNYGKKEKRRRKK
jgi:DNA mismatch endonuclease (patch repair protein)